MLNDAMKALTTRKPIALTTTSLCSGAFTARIARTQRLRVLRIAGWPSAGWENVERDVNAGLFKRCGLDVRTVTFASAAEAVAALSGDAADIACADTLTAVEACARTAQLHFIALTAGSAYGYVGLAPVIDEKGYPLARFARALRDNAEAEYVDARDLQALIDRCVADKLIATTFSANDHISSLAVVSGTR